MEKYFLITLMCILTNAFSQVNPNHHYVKSYTRNDGTVVQGHYKTNPNSTNMDNYSTKPNINPWTGEPGTVLPDNKLMPTTSGDSWINSSSSYDLPTTSGDSWINSSSSYDLPTTSGESWINSSSSYDLPTISREGWINSSSSYDLPTISRESWINSSSSYDLPTISRESWINSSSSYPKTIKYSTLKVDNQMQNAINYHNKYDKPKRLAIESKLSLLGYYVGEIDGAFDLNTINAIEMFQLSELLEIDGKVGKNTLERLLQK